MHFKQWDSEVTVPRGLNCSSLILTDNHRCVQVPYGSSLVSSFKDRDMTSWRRTSTDESQTWRRRMRVSSVAFFFYFRRLELTHPAVSSSNRDGSR